MQSANLNSQCFIQIAEKPFLDRPANGDRPRTIEGEDIFKADEHMTCAKANHRLLAGTSNLAGYLHPLKHVRSAYVARDEHTAIFVRDELRA